MEMSEFVDFARSETTISTFLREISTDLEEQHGAPAGMDRFMDIPSAWLAFLIPLLWFLVKEGALPWLKLGWEWQDIKRQGLKKRLEDHARKLELKPKPTGKAIDALVKKLETISSDDRLNESLMSFIEEDNHE